MRQDEMVDIGELVKRRGRETIRPANQASSNQPLKKVLLKGAIITGLHVEKKRVKKNNMHTAWFIL